MNTTHLIIITAVLSLSMGIFVWRFSPNTSTSKLFTLLATIISFWVLINYFLQIRPSMTLMKTTLALGPFIVIIGLAWLRSFKSDKFSSSFVGILILLAISALLMAFFIYFDRLIIKEVTTSTSVKLGDYFYLYVIYLASLFAVFIGYLLAIYISAVDEDKKKLRYVGYGLAGFILCVVLFDLVLPLIGITKLSMLDGPSSIIFIGSTAFSIVKNNLFDLKIITTEFLVVLIVLVLALQIFLIKIPSFVVADIIVLIIVSYLSFLLVKSTRVEAVHLKQLASDAEELKSLDKMKDEFMMMTTHEINTPLTIIRGTVDLIENTNAGGFTPKQKEMFKPIEDSTARLAEMSTDISAAVNIDQHKVQLIKQPLDLIALLKEIVDKYQPKAKEKNIVFELVLPPFTTSLKYIADKAKLNYVFTALIDNAIKYTDKGAVKVELSKEASGIMIKVIDNGRGIDENLQTKLFDRFFQAERFDINNPQEQQGVGLSLFVSRNYIDLHGGKIALKSVKNSGSTFCVTLPIISQETTTQPATNSATTTS